MCFLLCHESESSTLHQYALVYMVGARLRIFEGTALECSGNCGMQISLMRATTAQYSFFSISWPFFPSAFVSFCPSAVSWQNDFTTAKRDACRTSRLHILPISSVQTSDPYCGTQRSTYRKHLFNDPFNYLQRWRISIRPPITRYPAT